MSITIRDVANEAGVSVSTVSKVLNKSPLISQVTTEKVLDVMERLNYHPNLRARNFAQQTTHNIVFISRIEKNAAFTNPHLFEIMCGAESSLRKKGYSLTFFSLGPSDDEVSEVEAIIEQKKADGIILHESSISKKLAYLLLRHNFPHIVIGHPDFESELCWIDTNNNLSGSIAARHLLSAGFKEIAFIGGDNTDLISLHRLEGVKTAAEDLGLPLRSVYIQSGAVSIEEARKKADILIRNVHPDAVICANNTIALGVVSAIPALKLSIPKDIGIITFDDYPYSRITVPMLTVVNIDVYDMGIQAGKMLLRKIMNPDFQVQSYTTLPTLIVRGSTVLDE